ncbi:small multi-drug export protein [Thermoanaerobacter sp. CM-CNRG TB177]|uniref:Small multi-drug export protein n=2 Tax=Thermoanaerobacter TaxID=1754 RepID=E8UV64_THEBF|nr:MULTISPECIES: small multi-drug export protein [Thermoanaerobacter]ABY95235.1 putative small multi-drug export [Thermoanaerobacter pseudethanolicus ATCC 33223]ADV80185.1 small multi-drug export protein [Thermoanaerobacter brockii subsp. finnii Ako-1]MBT1279492.1 small multi-drug export protein [Thermoanaerobacter sp. CM-CNRG TB177]
MESFVKEILNFLPRELAVLFIAALPVIELRGAIPIGISLGLSPFYTTIISLIGSMIPAPFILFTIKPIFVRLKKTRLFKKLVDKLTDRSLKYNGEKIQKYGVWGLVLVVAIPLPGTGVWSGSLAAALLNMQFKQALSAIFIGNIIAAILVMILSYGVGSLFF